MLTVVAFLLLLEPLHFATEVLRVLPTIAYRGSLAIVELVAHALAAALATAGAFALLNRSPVAARVATAAIVVSVARVLQSLTWTTLPSDTLPGHHLVNAAVTAVVGGVSVWLVQRAGRLSR
jgi:hypothetical protein